MSEGTSPSSSSDEGSKSTPSNLPKAATRQRKKRTSDSEDEDYVAEEEATSKRIEPAQGTKPGLKIKRPAGRQPMSKARASAATGSWGVGFSVEALAFDMGCLPAGLLIFSPGFVP